MFPPHGRCLSPHEHVCPHTAKVCPPHGHVCPHGQGLSPTRTMFPPHGRCLSPHEHVCPHTAKVCPPHGHVCPHGQGLSPTRTMFPPHGRCLSPHTDMFVPTWTRVMYTMFVPSWNNTVSTRFAIKGVFMMLSPLWFVLLWLRLAPLGLVSHNHTHQGQYKHAFKTKLLEWVNTWDFQRPQFTITICCHFQLFSLLSLIVTSLFQVSTLYIISTHHFNFLITLSVVMLLFQVPRSCELCCNWSIKTDNTCAVNFYSDFILYTIETELSSFPAKCYPN